jgi:heme exporter protein D
MLTGVAVITVVSLAALVVAIVVSSEVVAWACVGLCVVGLILLMVDGLRRRRRHDEVVSATQ